MQHSWNIETRRTVVAELQAGIKGEVRADDFTRGLYSTDASIYQIEPLAVAFPQSTREVQHIVRVAAKHRFPVLPRGGGTSLSGQSIGPAVILDFSRSMNRILEFEPQKRLIKVEPGVVLEQLNAFLKPYGLQFGPEVATSSRATIGGMIGNNSAGSRSLVNGKTLDHVRELEAVLADGSVIQCGPHSPAQLAEKQRQTDLEGQLYRVLPELVQEHARDIQARFPKLVRRVSGYNLDSLLPEFARQLPVAPAAAQLDLDWPDRKQWNLSKLLVGSEGTLGIVTSAVLHTIPLPTERGVACLLFDSVDTALQAVQACLACQPSAVELLDKHIVELSRENLTYRKSLDFIQGDPAALLIVEFQSDKIIRINDSLALLEQRLQGQPGLVQIIRAEFPEQREQLWRCREAGAPLLLSIPGARKPIAFVEDPAVDPAKLPEFTRRFREIITKHGTAGAFYGHASVGCLHLRPMLDTKDRGDLQRLKLIAEEVAKLVVEFKGSLSGEHGDGLSRSAYLPLMYGPRLMAAFELIKRVFDPQGIFNPGKITAAPSPIADLRYGMEYRPAPVANFLDFSHEAHLADVPANRGFLAAAEQCNGSGVCRKTHTGTMCPSFMATGDEEHSTRGRANALRLALSGQLPPGSLTSQRMYDVFDLCLMCQGCKSECPSNVDVAKLKVEFLGHYYQAHRPSWGTIVQAHVPWINRIGSALAPVSNWMSEVPGLNHVLEWLLGIDHRRQLPQFVWQNFQRWFRAHRPHPHAGERGTVVLLDDCLTSYCEPQVNRSAVTLLEQAGYRVELANLWCCGRPLISKGLLEPARKLAQRNLGILSEYVARGWTILGAEPSCLLTLSHEYPDIFPSHAADQVRAHTHLLDVWLSERWSQGEVSELHFTPHAQTALLHGHCQQKALIGTQETKRMLQNVPDLLVKEVDSGCCGMAGSFGYEHYDLSQKIGERVLFPAVEQHGTGPVVAPGFSCRHQIHARTGKRALHPLELLARQLRETDVRRQQNR